MAARIYEISVRVLKNISRVSAARERRNAKLNKVRVVLLTVLASQRESVLSAEQVSSVFEYGKNTMLLTESAWPRNVCRHRSLQGKMMNYELVHLTTLETGRFDTKSFRYELNFFAFTSSLVCP